MSVKDLRESRAKIAADLKALTTAPMTPESREKIDNLLAESRSLADDIKRSEATEALDAELRSTKRPPRSEPSTEIDGDIEKRERDAFEVYVRRGEKRMSAEQRELLLERRDVTTTSAGALVPQAFNGVLIEATKLIGNTLSVVNRKVTNNNGAPMKFSLANDTGNVVTMIGETNVVTESDPGFSTFTVSTDMVASLIKASIQELADSAFSLDPWFRKSFGLRYARGLEAIITNGNGSNVASLVSGAVLGATSASPAGPVYADFIAAYGALDGTYVTNGKWMMNHASRVYLMGLLDGFGRPFFTTNPQTGTLDNILGQPIVINQSLPNTNAAASHGILFGDFESGYTFRTDGDLTIERLDERFKDTLEVGFLAHGRVGGSVTDAGTHPYVSLVTHA